MRKKAETYAAIAEADKARGAWIDPRNASLTFREVSDRWLVSNPTKRPTTQATDEIMLRVHIVPTFGDRRVGGITRADVQALVNSWAAIAAPRTVRRRFGVLSSVFIFAAEIRLGRPLSRPWRQAPRCHGHPVPKPR